MTELNMNILHDYPGAVVHCKTEDEAVHLLRYLKKHYPIKVSNWRGENTEWDEYGDRTVYYVYWDQPNRKMLYGHKEAFIGTGYIVEFSDLICDTVDLPIQSSDMAIESLFG